MARKQGSHSEITRPKIHQAAMQLIARHGWAAVSMRQIAAEVGVQVGALYNYTTDKQSLLFDLMNGHMEELLAAVEAQNFAQGDPFDQLEAFTRFHLRWHLQRREGVILSYMELRNLTPENFTRIEQLRDKYEALLEGILIKGVKWGGFQLDDTRIATMAFIAMLTGVTNWYKEGGRLDLGQVEKIYVELLRNSVCGTPLPLQAAQ